MMKQDSCEAGTSCTSEELERMIQSYGNMMLRISFLYLKNADDAEDAVQEAWIKIYSRIPKFESEQIEKAWIMQVTVNICKDHLRSAWSRKMIPVENLPETGECAAYDEHDDALHCAVMNLEQKYKTTVLLYYYAGFGIAEIAEILNKPLSTVSVRLMRARRQLKKQLISEYCQ